MEFKPLELKSQNYFKEAPQAKQMTESLTKFDLDALNVCFLPALSAFQALAYNLLPF